MILSHGGIGNQPPPHTPSEGPWYPLESPLVEHSGEEAADLSDAEREVLEKEIDQEISAAIERAESFQPDVLEPFRHAFATMPPHLETQMREFQEYLKD